MPRLALRRFIGPALLFLTAFAVLWKGGKSLETTWLLALFAGLTIYLAWWGGMRAALTKTQRVIWLAAVGFVAWTVIAFLASSTRNYGLDEVLRDASFMLLLLFLLRERDEEHAFAAKLADTLTVAALIACAIGFLVYVFQPVNRFVGTFFDQRFHTDYWPNAWAQFLLLAWPMAVLSVERYAGRAKKASVFLGGGALGVLLGALLLSFSRGALIAFGGQLLLLAILGLRPIIQRPAVLKRLAGSIPLAIVVGLGMFAGGNALRGHFHDVQSVSEKVTFTADEGRSSIDERAQFWSQAWKLTLYRPIVGWGPYSFRFVQPTLQRHVLATSDHPHNVFLKLSMERGIPAAMLFAVIVLLVFVPSAARELSGAASTPRRLMLVAAAGVLAHNLIDFNLQFVGIALPWWLMLGLLAAEGRRGNPGMTPRRWVARGTEIAIAGVLLVVTLIEGRYLVTSSFGRHAQAAGKPQEAILWYDRSAGEIFSRDLHLSRTQLALEAGDLRAASLALGDYLTENEQDARAWNLAYDLARVSGNAEEALRAATLAYQGGRYDFVAINRSMLAALREAQADLTPWRPEFDALFDAYAEAIELNTHFIVLSQNADDFLGWADELAAAFPERAAHYHEAAERAKQEMDRVRELYSARRPGILW
jgi:O-antigen ligase